jgi:hypothetical protein
VVAKHPFLDRANALNRFLRTLKCADSAATRDPLRARKEGKKLDEFWIKTVSLSFYQG